MAMIRILTFGKQVPLYLHESDVAPRVGESVLHKDKLYIVHEIIHELRADVVCVYVKEK